MMTREELLDYLGKYEPKVIIECDNVHQAMHLGPLLEKTLDIPVTPWDTSTDGYFWKYLLRGYGGAATVNAYRSGSSERARRCGVPIVSYDEFMETFCGAANHKVAVDDLL